MSVDKHRSITWKCWCCANLLILADVVSCVELSQNARPIFEKLHPTNESKLHIPSRSADLFIANVPLKNGIRANKQNQLCQTRALYRTTFCNLKCSTVFQTFRKQTARRSIAVQLQSGSTWLTLACKKVVKLSEPTVMQGYLSLRILWASGTVTYA